MSPEQLAEKIRAIIEKQIVAIESDVISEPIFKLDMLAKVALILQRIRVSSPAVNAGTGKTYTDKELIQNGGTLDE